MRLSPRLAEGFWGPENIEGGQTYESICLHACSQVCSAERRDDSIRHPDATRPHDCSEPASLTLSNARAMDIRCRWPPESVTPLSPTIVLYPLGKPLQVVHTVCFVRIRLESRNYPQSLPECCVPRPRQTSKPTRGSTPDKVVGVRLAGGFVDLLVGRTRLAVADVLYDAGVEQDRLLRAQSVRSTPWVRYRLNKQHTRASSMVATMQSIAKAASPRSTQQFTIHRPPGQCSQSAGP